MDVRHRREELPPPAKQVVDFKNLAPLSRALREVPWPRSAKSGYRIDIAVVGSEGGEMEAIIPGNSAKSPLIHCFWTGRK